MKNIFLGSLIITVIIASFIFFINFFINSIPEADYKLIKKGAVENVEYLNKDGFGSVSKTVLHFTDGSSIVLCGNHDLYNKSCVEVYKATNKICLADKIELC